MERQNATVALLNTGYLQKPEVTLPSKHSGKIFLKVVGLS